VDIFPQRRLKTVIIEVSRPSLHVPESALLAAVTMHESFENYAVICGEASCSRLSVDSISDVENIMLFYSEYVA
jgi:hypothetical protein